MSVGAGALSTIACARASAPAGAASQEEQDWNQIDWPKVERNLRRLQVRIAKATMEGRWNRVGALQHLLTRSFSGKALAVRRVTGNRGKRTPGVDKEIWSTAARKWQAMGELRRRGYKPMPLRRVWIPKRGGSNKQRPLSMPVMRDRAFQALYLQALIPVAECRADQSSFGFRPKRSAADAMARCFTLLAQRHSAKQALISPSTTHSYEREQKK